VTRPLQWLPALFVWSTGCDNIDETVQGLGTLYNPCGPDYAPEDCPGGQPAGGSGEHPLADITGSRGEHILEVTTLACTIRLDSVGSSVQADLCPDCSLTLQMDHVNLDDGCGVGSFSYTSVIGLVPDDGAYVVYLSLDGADWYAAGDGFVENNVLTYDLRAVYDTSYGGYYDAYPAYGFYGVHDLTRD
jgi:hypothetical protein